jgi:hypothetical protein
MVWNYALSGATIANHYLGNFCCIQNAASGMLSWIKFNEQTGTTATDSIQTTNNLYTWGGTGGTGWTASTSNGRCVAGYWAGYQLSVSTTNTNVGTAITLTISLIDQKGIVMTSATYPGALPAASSVTVNFLGTAGGSAVSVGASTSVSLSNGAGSVSFSSSAGGTITFSLTDSASNGRSTTITSPLVSVSACGAGTSNGW